MTNTNADLMFMQAMDLVHASNIRQTSSPKDDSEMKASILSQGGVQQNLIGAPRKSDGKIAIFAGGRRLTNTQALIEEGKLSADFEIPVMVRKDIDPDSTEAIEIALSENVVRAEMDYIDVCNAMMMLSSAGRSDDEIAASFDFRPKTVKERLLIATLVPEAQDLVRSGVRNLDWARALTIADKAMQTKICDDISTNPNAWKAGEDIRAYLTKSTIETDNALFDINDYQGTIISDFFEGDKFADVDKFWELQNEAIAERQRNMETEGYGLGVAVLYEPFEDWRYEEASDMAEAMAFIEVMPNGKVREIRNVKLLTSDAAPMAIDEAAAQHAEADFSGELAPFEVRATPRVCEYASAQRSAMIQARLAGDFRASLEYTVLAFLGHRSACFGAAMFQIPGKDIIKTGPAFDARSAAINAVMEVTGSAGDEPDFAVREATLVSIVRGMDDAKLQQLFTLLVSLRSGQQKRNGMDSNEASLANIYGADINIREFWHPTESFFLTMSTEDLRRLASELIPTASPNAFAHSKAKNLIKALCTAFDQAATGAMPPAQADRLNSWVPGVMQFPARIVTMDELEDSIFDDSNDLAASIFGVEEEEVAA